VRVLSTSMALKEFTGTLALLCAYGFFKVRSISDEVH